jgi:hexosaminidase
VNVVPAPRLVEPTSGGLVLSESTTVAADAFEGVVSRQLESLRELTGYPMPLMGEAATVRVTRGEALPAEGYRIAVGPEFAEIAAADEAGAFYAFQTLTQLIEASATTGGAGWVLPAVAIEDSPRFPYRGLHLDVGRYFFDVEFVKRYIDTMARFKLNRFHWHLTEDQGWRVEIDAYPRLTSVGAWRAQSPVEKNLDPYVGDGTPHGGFYTKEEIREVVAYAAERFVTVIPEIEMPGHATAAIAAYPQLGCTGEQLEVSTIWGVHDTIFCPSEETFEFIEAVLGEVVELFPSEYIHIGADEVPKRQWEESELAQAVMEREGLADESELQSWFIRRVERILGQYNRRLIGWDEILEGGLAPNATVMSWRGTEGGIEAARQGHDVIMSPVEHAYFDFYQGDPETEPLAMNWAGFEIDLARAYEFEPVPAELTDEQARHILGPQANLWTEYISTPEYAEYMAYPRALALAEVGWSPPEMRDYDDFVARLRAVLPMLDRLGVNYRPLDR